MIEGTLSVLLEVVLVLMLLCIDVFVRSVDDVESAAIGCVDVVDVCDVWDIEIRLLVVDELDG
jgi:hypothetical protein